MKKIFLSLFVTLILPFISLPVNAQEIRMGILNNPLDWFVSQWDGRSGKASDGTGLLRDARDGSKRYGQRAKRGVLTNDVDQIVSNRIWNPNGFNEIYGRIKDGQDEGPAMVQVFSRTGQELFSKSWSYKGHKTNGDWRKWSFSVNNPSVLNGASVVYTLGEKPNGNKNGAVVVTGVEVAAEASCETARRSRLSNMPSVRDIQANRKGGNWNSDQKDPNSNHNHNEGKGRGRNKD